MKRCKKTEMQKCGHWENGFCSAENCSYQIKPLTNFERIKNMTIEEMAQTINDKTYGCVFRFGCPCECGDNYPENCVEKIEEWLASDVEDTAHPTEKGCTGKRCPMQVGYDVKNCKDKDCIYRTETEKGGEWG